MNRTGIVTVCISMLLLACSNEDSTQKTESDSVKHETSTLDNASTALAPGTDIMKDMRSEIKQNTAEMVEKTQEEKADLTENIKAMSEATANKVQQIATGTKEIVAALAAPDRDSILSLAKKSGCLNCHSVEKKIVGPAWSDVSRRYKGQNGARAQLIEKVKKGGGGNWTEITGGIPMPANSPRVADTDIEALVDFILSLE